MQIFDDVVVVSICCAQWFQDKICEIENLDSNLQKLHAALKALVTHRRELSGLTGAVAKSAAILSTCEEHTGLSRALSQLADTEEKVELLRSEQANSDLYILSEIIKDYLGLIGAIKDVFHERVKVNSLQCDFRKRKTFGKNHLFSFQNSNVFEHCANFPASAFRFSKIGNIHRCN